MPDALAHRPAPATELDLPTKSYHPTHEHDDEDAPSLSHKEHRMCEWATD